MYNLEILYVGTSYVSLDIKCVSVLKKIIIVFFAFLF